MASRLRPTPETGRVAATKQPASQLGPSWAQRGSREARLAFRQAQKRGDREGAMRIAGEAEEQGYASQASIGSAEERIAGQYQGRQKDTAITAEIETALTPPGLSRADGQPRITMDMRRGDPGFQDQTGPTLADRYRSAQEVLGGASVRTAEPSATRPPIPEAPAAPGASQPPENPVTGESTPVTGDASARLGQRRWSPVPQGLAGRQALASNLRKSIAAGGDLSGDRLKRAKAEADRLGVTPEQFLSELQDIGTSVSSEDLKTLMPADDRSLDQRLRSYQNKYLGGGPTSELPAQLRASAAANASAAEAMRRARERSAAPAPTPARPPALSPVPTDAPSRSSLVGGSPAPSARSSPLSASIASRLGQAARQLTPASLAGRAVAASSGATRGAAESAVAASVQGARAVRGAALDAASTAAVPPAAVRRQATDFVGDRVIAMDRRRRQIAEFLQAARPPRR